MDRKTELLKNIRDEVLALSKSPLYEYRTKNKYFPVIGEGSHDAKIMFVGEAPGRNEAKTGKPFCGRAGEILNELLLNTDIKREDVYITNIVKDRPQENRDPTQEEIDIYGPFLDRQIDILQPSIIASLGRYSMVYIMEKFKLHELLKPISVLHGKSFPATASYGPVTIIPLYHPAVAVYNVHMKGALMEDFKVLNQFR